MTKLVETAVMDTDFCRDRRNRHIAHRDLNLALETPAILLKAGSRKRVDEAFRSVVAVLNAISRHYMDSDLHFRTSDIGGAMSLLYVLDHGLRAERHARSGQGLVYAEDFFRHDV